MELLEDVARFEEALRVLKVGIDQDDFEARVNAFRVHLEEFRHKVQQGAADTNDETRREACLEMLKLLDTNAQKMYGDFENKI